MLVMVGITCLILELKMPGVSVPGDHRRGLLRAVLLVALAAARADHLLAVLLFLLGLVLIGLEIFVLPGFGVSGISGILLMVGSLGLVALRQLAADRVEDWVSFGQHAGAVRPEHAGGGGGGVHRRRAICRTSRTPTA